MRILLTGCTGGYGQAIADVATQRGHSILGLARDHDKLSAMQASGLLERQLSCDLSVSNRDNPALIAAIHDFNPQVIINNAGVGSKGNTIAKERPAALTTAFHVNVLAPFELVQIASEPSGQDLRLVVNISSRRGSFYDNARDETAVKCSYTYRITKGAQNMLTACMATDPLLAGVRVLSIHPGKLTTGLGVSDASLDPRLSAERLLQMFEQLPAEGDYFSLQDHTPRRMNW
ncbi:SDR family NAD(P)-dependent oxidoreductase [Vibrio sp. nBUS_14]|uniref:SDR family NAD(P)-dependent oxidoreductase n=1 Tax=Vibrio sp. nBUS_14 TaxID=3395321 RepID=UPI003EBB4F64